MKIAVYAICKNEEKFASRWAQTAAEADEVVVLDTGSEDNSVALLRQRGVSVYEERVEPWRFDVARNRSLEQVSADADVCVCLDLDEVLSPGWRQAIERAWQGCDQLEYRYVWSFTPDGSDGVVFYACKIHARHGFRWIHPVHEVLSCDHTPRIARAGGLQIEHHPDPAKSRAQYLPLLELAVRENPRSDRNVHYLGREYLFRGRWRDCIETLSRHVLMPEAVWADEKSASFRYMARAHRALGEGEAAEACLLQAAALAPSLREPWVELGTLYYDRQDWTGVAYAMERALRIQTRPETYLSEPESWGALPWDLLSLAWHYLGRPAPAVEAVKKALEYSPGDARLRENLRLMQAGFPENNAVPRADVL